MNSIAWLAVGTVAGYALASLLIRPTDCCARVSAGVRTEVQDKLGSGAVLVGDALNIWPTAPGWLSFLGVKS